MVALKTRRLARLGVATAATLAVLGIIVIVSDPDTRTALFEASVFNPFRFYKCATFQLLHSNDCIFVKADGGHLYGPSRVDPNIAPDFHRQIVDEDGHPVNYNGEPFRDGDHIVPWPEKVEGNQWQYVLSLELVGPLRDAMMYYPFALVEKDDVNHTRWRKLTKVFRNCHIHEYSSGLGSFLGRNRQYSNDEMYKLLKDPHHQDISDEVMAYLDEGTLQLQCLMLSENIASPVCASISFANGIATSQVSDCWMEAYEELWTRDVATTMTTMNDVISDGSISEEGSDKSRRHKKHVKEEKRKADVKKANKAKQNAAIKARANGKAGGKAGGKA